MTTFPYFWRCTFLSLSLPHIQLLEKWLPLPSSDLAIIVKQILYSTIYYEFSGGFLRAMTSCRSPAGLDVVASTLPPTWNFISQACVSILVQYPHLLPWVSCWLCFHCPSLVLFSVHPFWVSSSSSPPSAILRTPVAPSPVSEPQRPKLHQLPIGQSTWCLTGQLSKICYNEG